MPQHVPPHFFYSAHPLYQQWYNSHHFQSELNHILTQEIIHFYGANKHLKEQEESNCEHVIKRLKSCVFEIHPKASIRTFGSYTTRLMIPGSDIDIQVSLAPSSPVTTKKSSQFSKAQSPISTSQQSTPDTTTLDAPPRNGIIAFLRNLHARVLSSGLTTSDPLLIENTAVPVLKYEDSKYKQKVDVSVNSENALKAVEIIQSFNQQFDQFKYLVIIVKYFLKQRNLNDVFSGGLSSYAICLLVISYLQLAAKRGGHSLSNTSLGQHLVEFFALFGTNFSFETTGIDVRNGGRHFELESQQPTLNSSPPSSSPQGTESTKSQLVNAQATSSQLSCESTSYPKPVKLHLVDPNDESNVVTRATFRMVQIRDAFAEAHNLLTSTPAGESPLSRIIVNELLHAASVPPPVAPQVPPTNATPPVANTSSVPPHFPPQIPPHQFPPQGMPREFEEEAMRRHHLLQHFPLNMYADMERLRQECSRLQHENAKLKDEHSEFRKHSSKRENRQLRQENERLKTILQQTENEVMTNRKRLSHLEERSKKENTIMTELKEQLKELSDKYRISSKRNIQFEEQNRILDLKMSELKQRCHRYEAEKKQQKKHSIQYSQDKLLYRIERDKAPFPEDIYGEKEWAARPNSTSPTPFGREDERTIANFLKSVEAEDIDAIREMLQSKRVDVNCSNFMKFTPLYVSLRKIVEKLKSGHRRDTNADICLLLLDFGAKPDLKKDEVFCSDLSLACRTNHVVLVQRLLQAGADINFCSQTEPTPMHAAIQNTYDCPNNIQIIETLVEQPHLNLDAVHNGQDILQFVVLNNRLDVLKCILERQSTTEKKLEILHSRHTSYELNLLMLACYHQHHEMARYLLNQGANVNALSGADPQETVFAYIWSTHECPIELSELLLEDQYNYRITMEDILRVKAKGALNLASAMHLKMKLQRISEIDNEDDSIIPVGTTSPRAGSEPKSNGHGFSNTVDSISLNSSNTTSRESDADSFSSDEILPEVLSSDSLRQQQKSRYQKTNQNPSQSQQLNHKQQNNSSSTRPVLTHQQKVLRGRDTVSEIGNRVNSVISAEEMQSRRKMYNRKHLHQKLEQNIRSTPDESSGVSMNEGDILLMEAEKDEQLAEDPKEPPSRSSLNQVRKEMKTAPCASPLSSSTDPKKSSQKKNRKKDKKKKNSVMNSVAKPLTPSHPEEERLIEKIKKMSTNMSELIQPVRAEFSASSVDVNYRSPQHSNKSFLHFLVEVGAYAVVPALLEMGADLNAVTIEKQTPLMLACRQLLSQIRLKDSQARQNCIVYESLIELLLKHKADTQCADQNKDTVLHIACEGIPMHVFKNLLRANAPVNGQNKKMQTPLHTLLLCDSELVPPEKMCDYLDLFLNEADLDLSLRDEEHRNILTLAIERQVEGVCEKLFASPKVVVDAKIIPPKSSDRKDKKIPLLLFALDKWMHTVPYRNQERSHAAEQIVASLLAHPNIDPNQHHRGKSIFLHAMDKCDSDVCAKFYSLCEKSGKKLQIGKSTRQEAVKKGFAWIKEKIPKKGKNKKVNVEKHSPSPSHLEENFGRGYEDYRLLQDEDDDRVVHPNSILKKRREKPVEVSYSQRASLLRGACGQGESLV